MSPRLLALLLASLVLTACASSPRDPVRVDSAGGVLDLRGWSFENSGPVVPQGWLWDADVLWSPESGRPESLPPALLAGPPDWGGTLPRSLRLRTARSVLVKATAHLTIMVPDRVNYGLQIGALPGAFRVWVNGVLVWQSGVLSADRQAYRSDGAGMVLSVQPEQGRLDIVAAFATDDPLVRHSELNRYWVVGPAKSMLEAEQTERNSRALQATFLFLGALVFLGIAFLRPQPRTLLPFVFFLGLCLLKLVANVEQAEPLLGPLWPGISPSVYLFLNHGLNLLPFPLMVLFLRRQFPQDVTFFSFLVVVVATALTTIWELVPFVALAGGWEDVYVAVMRSQWTFVLNLYVVLVVLFIFERMYHVHSKKRPLSGALFYGGIGIGLVILLPIPISYFFPVKYTFFLGWGIFFFLIVLGFALIRLQVRGTEAELGELAERLARKETLTRFVSLGWAARLGKESVESLRPGDRRSTEAVFVQVRSSTQGEPWLPLVGEVALSRQALQLDWREGTGTWVVDSWPETALAFALEVQRKLAAAHHPCRIVLTKAVVEFRIHDAGATWVPAVEGLPWQRLQSLDDTARTCGAALVLDVVLQDGLAIGGWRRHRHLTLGGREIELYEGEEPSLAEIKDKTLDAFETGLARAEAGHWEDAVEAMVAVVRQNPFDQAARTHLAEWESKL